IDELMALPDPIGQIQLGRELTEGLKLYQISCPIGVIGVIFESRPDALVQIATLCLKSGNGVLLKGGKEALHTNRALYDAIVLGGERAGLPAGWIGLIETRDEVKEMLACDEDIDLIIPRGSNAFVKYIMENSMIPVIGHADGLCHIYIDKQANVDLAVKVVVDAKTQAVAVCNAVETLLIHQNIADQALPQIAKALEGEGVTLVGDEKASRYYFMDIATDVDWETEYLDKKIAIKVVENIEEAITHINRYGSGHTDAIITEDEKAVKRFMMLVDSAGVYHNCSTRFADGYRYGFGAEVGISTGKIHARGPMGLEGLCTYKYQLFGTGNTVGEMEAGKKKYTFKPLQNN
ncbi:MAG: glutamate-5-semialdehyde dehydrogenase, partial [Clostridiales bacterium]|nr:glutamate-5-semialdehyde dehydrogenase [Clostridiales bacterium]